VAHRGRGTQKNRANKKIIKPLFFGAGKPRTFGGAPLDVARAIQILFTYGNQGPQTSKGRKAGRPKGAKTMTVFFPALLEISIERKKTGVEFLSTAGATAYHISCNDCGARWMAIFQGISPAHHSYESRFYFWVEVWHLFRLVL